MSDRRFKHGIGAADELSLRVSVATLVRVIFEHPNDGETMLALERRATLREDGTERAVHVKSQPFGGALRIHDLRAFQDIIGEFHFDSQHSHSEQDFRIFIRPSSWEAVKSFSLGQFNSTDHGILESDPGRELAEEFADIWGIRLQPHQYICQPVGTIVEDDPSPTENLSSRGYPTSRLYRIFQARIQDPSLASAMTAIHENCSDQNLGELALKDARNGGTGRRNAVLTLPLSQVTTTYLSIEPEARNSPISFQNHKLDETVAAVLEGITVPKYRRL